MKTWNLLKEDIANTASGGAIKGLGKPPEDGPPVRKKKRNKFAGSDVFEVSNEEYMNLMNGRKKHERWARKFNMEEIESKEIRNIAHKNPNRSIVLQNKMTGDMMYLRRFDK